MNWQPVESSQIAEVGYGEGHYGAETLGLRFKPFKGDSPITEYHYGGISVRVHRALLAAKDNPKSSIGKYFAENIKSKPDIYPFTKMGTINPTQPASTTKSTNGSVTETSSASTTTDGEIVESPGSALAKIDKMTADQIFVSNALDPLLIKIREEALVEAKKYDISTPDKRKGLKSLAFKLVKTRTFIEGLAKAHTIETKRKLALIDSEKRRVCDIIQGIEDEVRSPLTEWENKEKARVQKHEDAVLAIREMKPHLYLDVPLLVEAIKKLEAIDPDDFEEYRAPAIAAKEETLETLQSELDARKKRQAETEELERLRAEAAQRAEQDRIANATREAREQAERNAEAERVRIDGERLAAEQRAKDAELREQEAKDQALANQVAAVEAERKRVADQQKRETEAAEARATDAKHKERILQEAQTGLFDHCELPVALSRSVVEAIAKGLIPHVTIQY